MTAAVELCSLHGVVDDSEVVLYLTALGRNVDVYREVGEWTKLVNLRTPTVAPRHQKQDGATHKPIAKN